MCDFQKIQTGLIAAKQKNITFIKILLMNKEQTIAELKSIVKPYIANQEAFDNLTEDTDFINDLKINSANLVDVILDIEEKYDIIIDNEAMERMVNVNAAMLIIETKLSEKM
jgi:acyl carrier protein